MIKRIVSSVLLLVVFLSVVCACSDGKSNTPAATTAAQTEAPPAKKSVTMNVMSFNILAGNAKDIELRNGSGKKINMPISDRAPKLFSLLEGEKIDIAGLQEVCGTWIAFFNSKLKYPYKYIQYENLDNRQGGCVLYNSRKFEALSHGRFWLGKGAPTELKHSSKLEDGDSAFDRQCVWVLFKEIATDTVFLFMDTHLDWKSDEVSTMQAEILVGEMKKLKKQTEDAYSIEECPVIIVGDMNSRPTWGAHMKFTSALMRDTRVKSQGDTVESVYSTSPGANYVAPGYDYIADGHVIDFIFVSRKMITNNYKMIHASTNLCEYGEYISDHNAIIANVTYEQ